ncbi:MAG: hypothetical protein JOY98_04500, partial [Candidatus Eremiobacteraeota bacterium]|nr:hypothetical protein [Candidatus Eremiobacteraeota bacterium]
MKRWFAVCIALVFVTGCSGMGGGGNRFLPAPGTSNVAAGASAGVQAAATHRGPSLPVYVRVRIPRRHRGEHAPMHPATISPLTQSLSIVVNGGRAQTFNATTSSPNCSTGASGLTCTFKAAAPAGTDTFVVSTYTGTNGTGTILDQGIAVIVIAKGKANSPSITLGPVVSTASDSGMGSLRYAIGNANPGDTILFTLPAGTIVTLASPITISNRVSIAGPGVTTSVRERRNKVGMKENLTFSGVTISGNNANQVFIVKAGAIVTISGLIITAGLASVAHNPGGAISNSGYLTLAGDAVTASTSLVTTLRTIRTKTHRAHRPHHADPNQPPRPAEPVRVANLHPHCVPHDQYGGGVYNGGTLIVNGSTFSGNAVADVNSCSSGYGGAIYNDYYAPQLSVSNSTFSGNGGYEGGAAYNYSYYGSASFTNDVFTGNVGCSVGNGCPAICPSPSSSCTSYGDGYGAAIYDDEGPGVDITGSTFNNNVAGGGNGGYGEGGALYLDTQNPILTNNTFVNNVAGGGIGNCSYGYGGAIYFSGDQMQLNGNTFTNNFAGGDKYGDGGAIYQSDFMNASNNTFTGNQAVGSGSPCFTNGYGYGGAVYGDDYLTMVNSTFTGNVATGSEEGYGGALVLYDYTTLTNDTFTNNAAIGTGATDNDSYAYGGALYTDDYVKIGNSTFTGNMGNAVGPYGYEVYGGTIYNTDTLNLTNNTFASNSAVATYPA